MTGYIERKAVNEIIKTLAREPYYYHDGEDFYNGVCAVDGEIAMLPDADVVEAVHAYWKTREHHNDYLWVECSNCGFRVENYVAVKLGISSTDVIGNKWNGCPICLAKMDGERSGYT